MFQKSVIFIEFLNFFLLFILTIKLGTYVVQSSYFIILLQESIEVLLECNLQESYGVGKFLSQAKEKRELEGAIKTHPNSGASN